MSSPHGVRGPLGNVIRDDGDERIGVPDARQGLQGVSAAGADGIAYSGVQPRRGDTEGSWDASWRSESAPKDWAGSPGVGKSLQAAFDRSSIPA